MGQSNLALAKSHAKVQFSTFYVGGKLYGIEVSSVQEVTKTLPITAVPLAPDFIRGLINLRGQIATAIGMKELLGLKGQSPEELMNVVCRRDGILISLLVDQIGDVIELDSQDYEPTPDTVSPHIARFMQGVFKVSDNLLSVIEVKKILELLNDQNSVNQNTISKEL